MIPKRLFAKMAEVHRAVGEIVGRWANLEHQLTQIFAIALGLNTKHASQLLLHIKTFALKMDLVDTAVKIKLGERPKRRWTSLVEFIRELSGDRNYVAHTPVVFHSKGDPNNAAVWEKADVKVGPAPMVRLADTGRVDPVELEELLELINDVQHAVELAMKFQDELKQPASNETLATEVARRRPPRKQRRESAPRTPKGPP